MRLSKSVVPKNYDILLYPDLEKRTFNGNEVITIIIHDATKTIAINSKSLTIISIKLLSDIKTHSLIESTYSCSEEFIYIHLQKQVIPGIYFIKIEFSGRLDKGIVGFYYSKNGSRTMVASKFQPTYARQAFPCFDEPEFKATYDVRLVRPNNFIALSNMPQNSETSHNDDDETYLVSFDTSKPMSTYLAVFVICDFDVSETTINGNIDDDVNDDDNNIILRNFYQRGQGNKIIFAESISKDSAEYFIKYFRVGYPLPKLDQIAIPDYVSGATEHWGLITYRETSFLIDPETSSSLNRRNVATTIAHELAHMWFGNLVTMMWWDETWLNEGFATYMSYKCLDVVRPQWGYMSSFPVRVLHGVFNIDATPASHPIVMEVTTPDQITAIFDTISYNKGASVLRMLDNFIGVENFQNAMTEYLEEYEYKNTVTQDLLDKLAVSFESENENLNLTHIMDTWTKQMGYPVVTVTSSDVPNQFRITQHRFLADPNTTTTQPEGDYRWFIPLTYKTNRNSNYEIKWFSDEDENATITVEDEDVSWILLNRDQIGYYRVNYEETHWDNLIDVLHNPNLDQLSPSERAMLINDAYSLADAKETSFRVPLSLTQYLINEVEWAPWAAAISRFNALQRHLQDSLGYRTFRSYMTTLIVPIYDSLGWDPPASTEEELQKNVLRSDILSFACSVGHEPALEEAIKRFREWSNDTNTDLHPDLKSTVYTYGIRGTGEQEWWKMWELYLKEEDAQERARFITALASTTDVLLLRSLLSLAWDVQNVRLQDHITLIQQVASNPAGTPIVWDHVRERWEDLVEKFTLNDRVLGSMIPSITGSFSTNFKLSEMNAFFSQYPDAGAGAGARAQALENVANNIVWRNEHEESIVAILDSIN